MKGKRREQLEGENRDSWQNGREDRDGHKPGVCHY